MSIHAWSPDPTLATYLAQDPTPVNRADEMHRKAQEHVEMTLLKKQYMEEATRADAPEPVSTHDRTANVLRPQTFKTMIGQNRLVHLMTRVVNNALDHGTPLDHVLLVGASGTGKSTVSHVIAHEMEVDVYEVEAPVSSETLLSLREVMRDGDILRVEEIHQQAIMDRRGKSASTQPEVLYGIMEDRVIATEHGPLPYPEITVIGTTTDEGMLPDAFINRFPLRPVLEHYTTPELELIANENARQLGISLTPAAARLFAQASRRVPRQINNYVKNAHTLTTTGRVTKADAIEVITDLNHCTLDGLTRDMQTMLRFLYTKAQRTNGQGETVYQASVNSIATACGKSRDTKAIALRVEPWLIEQGLVQVGHGGRLLTPAGIKRAQTL